MELRPDSQEILRYFGYGNGKPDLQTEKLMNECTETILKLVKPRYTYKIFDISLDLENERIILPGCNITFEGRDIYEHLRECRKCAVMAVTLGIEVDNAIRVAQVESMTKAMMLDACATEIIEKLCDEAEKEIAQIADKEGRKLNYRFSPGYGDFPITTQKIIGEILDVNRKIGLTITDKSLMIPRKSVTAVVGFANAIRKKKNRCANCSMNGKCRYRREGTTCGR